MLNYAKNTILSNFGIIGELAKLIQNKRQIEGISLINSILKMLLSGGTFYNIIRWKIIKMLINALKNKLLKKPLTKL